MSKWRVSMAMVLSLAAVAAAQIDSAALIEKLDPARGEAMAQSVIDELGGKPGAWLVFYMDRKVEPEKQAALESFLAGVRQADQSIPLLGCWTDTAVFAVRGEKTAFTSAMGDVMLAGLRGEGLTFRVASAEFSQQKKLGDAAFELGQALRPQSGQGLLILLSDSLVAHAGFADPPPLYARLRAALGTGVAIVGGNGAYLNKPVFVDDTVAPNLIAGLMISGPVQYKVVQEPGKIALSEPLSITKTAGKREIVELDGKPWAEVFQTYVQQDYPPEQFAEIIAKGGGAFGAISRKYPHALLTEHGELYVRLAHGLAPWGKGTHLPVECYDLPEPLPKLVVTRWADDQGACVRKGLQRLQAGLPEGQKLFLVFPCQSSAGHLKGKGREILEAVQAELPSGSSAVGFFPCGEHASLFEPPRDAQVQPGRYFQLSYPMAILAPAGE